MIAYVALVVALVGMLAYALSTNSKVQELGRVAFAMGLLVTLLVLAHQAIRVLP